MAELDGSNAVVRVYQWGLDLGGSLNETGGVGGLLSVKPASGVAQCVGYDGYRYYSSSTGKWLNHDLIEEGGGLNIYGFVRNEAASRIDADGLSDRNAPVKIGPIVPPPPLNTGGYGDLHDKTIAVTLRFSKCCATSCKDIAAGIYSDLKTFENWKPNTVAELYCYCCHRRTGNKDCSFIHSVRRNWILIDAS